MIVLQLKVCLVNGIFLNRFSYSHDSYGLLVVVATMGEYLRAFKGEFILNELLRITISHTRSNNLYRHIGGRQHGYDGYGNNILLYLFQLLGINKRLLLEP